MKPETRASFLNRSFRRSFRRKKTEDKASPTVSPIDEEQNAITMLRKELGDCIQPYHSDDVLRRFLKAKKFDVQETKNQIKHFLNFKHYFMPKDIGTWFFSEALHSQKIAKVIGFDNDGSLIRYINLGAADVKGLVHSVSTIEILKAVIWVLERDIMALVEENIKSGKNVSQILYIVDLKILSTIQILHKPVIDLAILGLTLFQEHFFEIWKSIIVINAPSYFNTVYKLLKPAILEEMHSKIYVYGSTNWKEALLLQIHPDVLPDCLGGNRVDYMVEPNIPFQLAEIVSIPESCFTAKDDMLDPTDPAVQTITVSAGGYANIPIPVIQDGSRIKFHINSKDHDIGICVFYESKSTVCHIEKFKKKENLKDVLSKFEQLAPAVRSHCNLKPEIGEIIAWKAGIYILHLDNSYSWMNSKLVCYKFQVVPPDSSHQSVASSIINSTKNLKL